MKKCTQCAQVLNDETNFCFKCGGANFEPAEETSGGYQQPTYQQPSQQPQQQSYYAPQPSYQQAPAYQQPAYQQSAYQQQPGYNNDEPATIGNYLLFFLFMIIPVFNIVYTIIVAVGSPTRKRSMTNFARAIIILWAISIVIGIIMAIAGVGIFADILSNNRYIY